MNSPATACIALAPIIVSVLLVGICRKFANFTSLAESTLPPDDKSAPPTTSAESSGATKQKDANTSKPKTPGTRLLDEGKYLEALPVLKKEWEDAKKAHGSDDEKTWECAHQYGAGLWRNFELFEGEKLAREILALREKKLGPEHPDTLASLSRLAALLHDKGDRAAAEPLYRRALAAQERTLGPEHPDTLKSVGNFAALLHHKGDRAAAEPLYRRAHEAYERTLGPEHPDTYTSAFNLARFYKDQKDLAKALPFAEQALKGFTKTLGDGHQYTISAQKTVDELKKTK